MNVNLIPCLSDNYSYFVIDPDSKKTCIVDPAEFDALDNFITKNKLTVDYILNTFGDCLPSPPGTPNNLKLDENLMQQHGKMCRIDQKIESHFSIYSKTTDSYLSNGTKIIKIGQLFPVGISPKSGILKN